LLLVRKTKSANRQPRVALRFRSFTSQTQGLQRSKSRSVLNFSFCPGASLALFSSRSRRSLTLLNTLQHRCFAPSPLLSFLQRLASRLPAQSKNVAQVLAKPFLCHSIWFPACRFRRIEGRSKPRRQGSSVADQLQRNAFRVKAQLQERPSSTGPAN